MYAPSEKCPPELQTEASFKENWLAALEQNIEKNPILRLWLEKKPVVNMQVVSELSYMSKGPLKAPIHQQWQLGRELGNISLITQTSRRITLPLAHVWSLTTR